jgi:hypothetical protein
LLSVLLIGSMPFLVCPRIEDARARSRAEESLGRLRACLGQPFDGETLRERAIAAELQRMNWPERCLPAAAGLEVALAALARSFPPECDGHCCDDDRDCRAIAEARTALADLRRLAKAGRLEGDPATRLFASAATLALETEAPTKNDVETPPEPVRPARPDRHAPLTRGGYDASALVLADGGRWRLLLHARDKHALVCDVNPDDASAECAPLPASIPIADSVLLVDGAPAAPLHVLARRDGDVAPERWGVYDAGSGGLVLPLEHETFGATVSPTGAVAALVHDGTGYFLTSPDAPATSLEPTAGRSLGPPLLFGSWLVVAQDAEAGVEVEAQPLAWRSERAQPGEPQSVATLADWHPTNVAMRGCRSEALTAVVVTAEPPEPRPVAIVLLHDGRDWQSHRVSLSDPRFGLACDSEAATLTVIEESEASDVEGGGVRGRYLTSQHRCEMTGCGQGRSTMTLHRRRRASRYLAGSLDGTLALLWRSNLGDVRLAMAAPDDLPSAPVQAVFEGDENGGYGWDRHGADLLTRDGWGLLLVGGETGGSLGTYGFVIGRDTGLRRLNGP